MCPVPALPALCGPTLPLLALPCLTADGVLVSKGELKVPDNAPKGKIPLTIPGVASASTVAPCLKASSRSSLLSKLTEAAAAPAVPAVPAVPVAAEERVPRSASFSALDGLGAGGSNDDDRI